ncbi:hypothetical protein [Micromonospora sp. WMMD737]|uniref:hypothetical protein n=1 Tax=Micromonospora sp. WMMD737 TaxID=3404113 RepID=UPI003B966011
MDTQDAMRVANRYAGQVAKAETLQGRARACRDAADRYRSDARVNQESTANHLTAARTIRDASVAAEHTRAAREAEAEAAREILAARYYEVQAEEYEAQALGTGTTLTRKEPSMGDGAIPTTAASASLAGPDSPTTSGVGDVLGYADGETCHGTDQVAAAAGPASVLALMDYGDGNNRWDGGQYIAVATSPGRWDPVTSNEHVASDGYAAPSIYQPPHLSAAEAETAARHLDELAERAEAGYQPPKPTKWSRAAQRLEHLLAGDADLATEKVRIVDDELPVTVKDLLALLRDKQPTTAEATRRHVAATAIDQAGGDTGALWMDLVDHDGTTRVVVTGVEGTEDPDDDYWQPYTAQHTPAQARELAAKLRTFATGARQTARSAIYLGDGADVAHLDWSTPTFDGGRTLKLSDGQDAVHLDLSPTQLRELCEALTATITTDDFADTPNAYWPWENDHRYIDWSDFEYERGFHLEIGDGTTTAAVTLTTTQLRAWRDRLAADTDPGVGYES